MLIGKQNNQISKVFNMSPPQIIVFGFTILIILGTVLLSLPISSKSGQGIGFEDALFTATSAVCVTGLVVVDTYSHWTVFGQTVILLLIQIGGLGIMSMATLFSLVLGRKMGLKARLTIQESLSDFTLSGVVKMLRNILIVTLVIELIGAVLLSTRLIPLYGLQNGVFKSVFHSVSAFCNAGFDIFGTPNNQFTSLVYFRNDPVLLLTICTLFIVGGLGFIVWRDVVIVRKFSNFMLHTKVVLLATFILTISGTILILLFEFNNSSTLKELPLMSKLINSFFHSVTPRTAGFNTLPMNTMTEPSKFITILLMFIGAAPGSTGGGIKVTTFSIIIIAIISYIKGNESVSIMYRRVPDTILKKALLLVTLSMCFVFITTMFLLIGNEGNFMQVLFESTSAFGTVGLSTGITPNLSTLSKYIITITMLVGRVGPLSAVLSLALRQNSKDLIYKYPEGKITVG